MPRKSRRTIILTTTVIVEIPVATRSAKSVAKSILQNVFDMKFIKCAIKIVTMLVGPYT